ncbi:hypothetical protein [Mycobacterium sp. NPDC050041]|uniref:hypothetical protein n=1 Tax=Mycobacterium sp. NPDC050041 TaxID=3364293 RepID=UPI003C2D671A
MNEGTDALGADVVEIGQSKMIELSWADLMLDSKNPRLEEVTDTSREAINALLELDAEKMIALARDISESASLSPFEIPGVIIEDGSYVVVEGNRRVAALRMLKSPDLVDDPRLRRRVEAIAANGTGPDAVGCNLFDTREDARHWIELRHNGEMGGRGVIPWTSDMSNRFSRAPGSQTDLAMQVRDLMLAAHPGDSELERQLNVIFRGGNNRDGKRIRARPTTLGRLVTPTAMQESFGYTIDRGTIRIVGPDAEVHAAFRQMIFDVSEGLRAQDIYSSPDFEDYISNHADLIVSPPAAPAPSAPGSGASPTPAPSAPPGPTPATPATPTPPVPPAPRRRLPKEERRIFQSLKLANFSLRTSKTLEQAQQLEIADVPAVAGVMVRVIVELCATEAIDKLGLTVTGQKTLRNKLKAVLLHLDPQIAHSVNRDPALAAAWMDSQKDNASNGLGVDLMNGYVHSFIQTAGVTDVRALSSSYRAVLERLDSEML